MERLQKFLARAGVTSRRAAEQLIVAGKVMVNNRRVTTLGTKIDPEKDRIQVENKQIKASETYIYYALHKPRGVVTTAADEPVFRRGKQGRKSVLDFVPQKPRVYPVGRLDKDSEGLLILTNNGEFTYQMTHPKFAHTKKYEVIARPIGAWSSPKGLKGPAHVLAMQELCAQRLNKMTRSMQIGRPHTLVQGAQLQDIQYNPKTHRVQFALVIAEGKKHQVREMVAGCGFEVEKLVRTRFGKLELGDLPPGQYRQVKRKDIFESVSNP